MSGRQKLVNFIRENTGKKYTLPTPKCKLYKGTIFYTLNDALAEGRKWEDDDTPFPTITLETNNYFRFYGSGAVVAKSGKLV